MIQQTKNILAFAPMPLRIVAGIGFMMHGLPKLFDIPGTQTSFINMGVTTDLAIIIGLLEFIGGLVILLGLLTRIAAGLLSIEMIGAILHVKLSKGFIGGYEFELLLISICFTLVILGPGKISIENYVLKREICPKGKQLYRKTTNTEIR